ncbi:hypothetical protein LCM17_23430 [Cereibacter sphaeroides]|nr:hypothetical protein [Cereibacter sphaeroides]
MAIGLKSTILGAQVSANLGLAQSVSDSLDAAALAFGSDLLLRVDPRDVYRPATNPTGKNAVHFMAPNRDPLLFRNPGSIEIATVPTLYNGEEVFVSTADTGGETNDMQVHFNSMGATVAFSVVGVAHFTAEMLGAGFHALLSFVRDGSNNEAMLVHQFAGGVNYLTGFADQASGGGANYNMDAGSEVAADTPFVFVWQVLASGGCRLFINTDLDGSILSSVGSGVPETGAMKLRICTTGTGAQQWLGALGRTYVFAGDILDTPEKKGLALALVVETMAKFGVE